MVERRSQGMGFLCPSDRGEGRGKEKGVENRREVTVPVRGGDGQGQAGANRLEQRKNHCRTIAFIDVPLVREADVSPLSREPHPAPEGPISLWRAPSLSPKGPILLQKAPSGSHIKWVRMLG